MDLQQKTRSSVVAVPPLARDASGQVDTDQNRRIIRYLESGGISVLLYGGNAVFYHVRPSHYARILQLLTELADPATLVIPSVGPAFGVMMDQADVLRDFDFPTAMVLPQREIADAEGTMRAVRLLAEQLQKPVVVYVKFDGWLDPEHVAQLFHEGLVSWVKYAIVRQDPRQDAYLHALLDLMPPDRIISGMGEQPAVVHLRDYHLAGFTSGCVCVAPALSMRMLQALQQGSFDQADRLRQQFKPLEDLRDRIQPIRVLHRAVELVEIARTGPMPPLLGELTDEQIAEVRAAAEQLMRHEQQASSEL